MLFRTGKESILPKAPKYCGSHSLSIVLPIVKSLSLTLRRRRPLLPGSCCLSYTGEFCSFFFQLIFSTHVFVGFSLNDMMTVPTEDDDDDDDDDDDNNDNEETASG